MNTVYIAELNTQITFPIVLFTYDRLMYSLPNNDSIAGYLLHYHRSLCASNGKIKLYGIAPAIDKKVWGNYVIIKKYKELKRIIQKQQMYNKYNASEFQPYYLSKLVHQEIPDEITKQIPTNIDTYLTYPTRSRAICNTSINFEFYTNELLKNIKFKLGLLFLDKFRSSS